MALPELPRVYLDTTYRAPTGKTIAVPAGGDLQAALNAASPGDRIALAAGASFRGPFTLPAKGAGWVYVESAALGQLPPPGTRVGPQHAGAMPKLLGPQGAPALQTASGAHGWRFAGVEFAPVAGAVQHDLVYPGSGGGAWDFTFDRCYIHGDPSVGGTLWGLRMDAASVALVDSWLANFRDTVFEASAVRVITGAGPFKIANSYIEAAGMSVIFGGQDPNVSGLISSDIEIRGNHMAKPLSWKIGDPTYAGTPWIVKNLLEFKNAQRALVDGNVFENNWRQADQDGFAVIFTPRNQNGGAPWALVHDVTFTRNIVRHTQNGIMVHGTDNNHPSGITLRILIRDNLFYDIGAFADRPLQWFPPGLFIGMDTGSSQDVTVDHNTAFAPAGPVQANSPQNGFAFTNNVAVGNMINPGNLPGLVCTHNALLGGNPSLYPVGNWFPAGTTPVVVAAGGGEDYHLVPGSPYLKASTDGKDVGADIDAVAAATANAISGGAGPVPPPPPPPGPPPAPAVQAVSWTGVANAVASAGGLRQSGPLPSGGVSLQTLPGDGHVEAVVDDPTGDYVLSLGAPGPDLVGPWAVHVAGYTVEAREQNWTLMAHVPAAKGDVIRIEVAGGAVRYLRNGAAFYASAAKPSGPLQAKAMLWSFGAAISGATIG